MPPDIPPELFNRIVCDLDNSSLKACSLASSVLCAASQPILFRTFTLSDGSVPHGIRSTPSFAEALEHLEESPHIARYITHLNVQFLGYTNPTAPHHLQRVLAKLANVRHFKIDGKSGCLMPGFPSVLVDFLSHRDLETLRVECLGKIPLPVFLLFLISPHILLLKSVWVESGIGQNTHVPSHMRTVHILELGTGTGRMDEILISPEAKKWLADLRHLSIVAHEATSSKIISSVAPTLRTLRIRFLGAHETNINTRVELALPLGDPFSRWLTTILSFLSPAACPTLGEIIIRYWPTHHTPCAEDLAATLAALHGLHLLRRFSALSRQETYYFCFRFRRRFDAAVEFRNDRHRAPTLMSRERPLVNISLLARQGSALAKPDYTGLPPRFLPPPRFVHRCSSFQLFRHLAR
ncbi:hypothetical protein B0H19DRAFT_1369036 [Mycena capillaripes]|nr:hypothetical protein B0H19DRAFT_1369036 [Mycena capillaripes]